MDISILARVRLVLKPQQTFVEHFSQNVLECPTGAASWHPFQGPAKLLVKPRGLGHREVAIGKLPEGLQLSGSLDSEPGVQNHPNPLLLIPVIGHVFHPFPRIRGAASLGSLVLAPRTAWKVTSPSKIAVFCPHVLAVGQAWKLSAHGKKEQKPAKKGWEGG